MNKLKKWYVPVTREFDERGLTTGALLGGNDKASEVRGASPTGPTRFINVSYLSAL
jgi:hypothetical protein